MQVNREYFEHEGVRYSYLCWGPSDVEANAASVKLEVGEGARGEVPSPRNAARDEFLASKETPGDESAAHGEDTPILLIHGFAQSAESWRTVAERLSQSYVVYAIDLVGFGNSDKNAPEKAYSLPKMGQAILAFVRQLSKKPLVVGYSLGGRVALSALLEAGPADFAGLVSGLVLESAGLGMASESDRIAAAERDAATARRLREMPLEDFMTYWENLPLFDSQKALPQQIRDAVRAGRLNNNPETLAQSVEQAGQHTMPDRSKVLAALEQLADGNFPVYYLAGGLDAKYSQFARSLPIKVKTRIFPGVGHNIHLETPDSFASFLSEIATASTKSHIR